MPAGVTTAFYVRTPAWHRRGRVIQNAPNSKEAIIAAGLNFKILQMPIPHPLLPGQFIPSKLANIRSDTLDVLGIVGAGYPALQHEDAFAFIDDLLGEGVRFECAGTLWGGRRVWMLARLPESVKILGDVIEPYMLFYNGHDGSAGVNICMTPVRAECQNLINFALATANRKWSARHSGDLSLKMEDARNALGLASKYLVELGAEADRLAQERLGPDDWTDVVSQLLPVPVAKEGRQQRESTVERIKERQHDLWQMMMAPDLDRLRWTKWGALNAVADYADHSEPVRKAPNWEDNHFADCIEGHPLIDKAYALITR